MNKLDTPQVGMRCSVLDDDEWMRFPRRGAKVYELPSEILRALGKAQLVRIAEIRRPGCQKGITLLHVGSVRDYLNRLAPESSAVQEPSA